MSTVKTMEFRREFFEKHLPKGYNGHLHILFNLTLLVGSLFYCFYKVENAALLSWGLLPLTFLYGNIAVFLIHKYPLHRLMKLMPFAYKAHTQWHHHYFTRNHIVVKKLDEVFILLFPWFVVAGYILGFLPLMYFVSSPLLNDNQVWIFLGSCSLYFLTYEMFHTISHLPDDHFILKFRPFKVMRSHHILHHDLAFMTDYNFNIVYPLSDWFMGTSYPFQMMKEFYEHKTIVITGAGNGLGAELSRQLARFKTKLHLIDLDVEKLNKLKASLAEEESEIHCYSGDVTSLEQLKEVEKNCDQVDIVIANAGVGGINPGHSFSPEIDRKIMEVNYFGTTNTFSAFKQKLIQNESAYFVGICSQASMRGLPMASSYSASKAAQSHLLESLRLDLRPMGVKVISVLPGFIKTKMTDHKEFQMPFTLTSRKSAMIVLKGIAKQKKVIIFPKMMSLLSRLNYNMPNFLYDYLVPKLSGANLKKEAKIF